MIVNVLDVPVQLTEPLVNVGVTVMVATTGAVPAFIAVNEGIVVTSPPLFAARPMEGVSFVQVYVTVPPERIVLKVTKAVAVLLHTI